MVSISTSLILLCAVAMGWSLPCLNIRQDKNDGLKIFQPSGGIFKDNFSLIRKRDISELLKNFANNYKPEGVQEYDNDLGASDDIPFRPLFAYRQEEKQKSISRRQRSVNEVFHDIHDKVLYFDNNDLILDNNKVFLPLYAFKTKHFVYKRRQRRSASTECPSGFDFNTKTDFYPTKPSDLKSAGVPSKSEKERVDDKKQNSQIEIANKKLEIDDQGETQDSEEELKTAESIVFHPLFSYRQRIGNRRPFRNGPGRF